MARDQCSTAATRAPAGPQTQHLAAESPSSEPSSNPVLHATPNTATMAAGGSLTTASGAVYPSSLSALALPLPELLRLHPHLTSIAVGAFIFATPSSPSLLLIRRSESEKAFPGLWEVPGGGVEPPPRDATLLDAVVREVREETGLTVTRIGRCYGWIEFAGRDGRMWRKWSFEVEVAGTAELVLDPEEHDRSVWVDGPGAIAEAGLDITAQPQREMILEALRIRSEEIGEAAGGGGGGGI